MTVEKCLHVGSASEIALLPTSSRTLRGTFRYKSFRIPPFLVQRKKAAASYSFPEFQRADSVSASSAGRHKQRQGSQGQQRSDGQGPSPAQSYASQSDAYLSSATRTKVPTPRQAEHKRVDPRLFGTRGLMIEIPGPPSC